MPNGFKVSGQAKVNGQWEILTPFFIDRFDDSFLRKGIKAFVPSKATKLALLITKCYHNEKRHVFGEIDVEELILTLSSYESNE